MPVVRMDPQATQAVPATAHAQPVTEAQPSVAQTVKQLVTEFAPRFFSEARVLARAKRNTFLAYLSFLGLGFAIKLALPTQPVPSAFVDFILASPDPFAVAGALAGLGFVVGGNLFSRADTNATRRRLWELAANPATPEDTRKALLQSLATS